MTETSLTMGRMHAHDVELRLRRAPFAAGSASVKRPSGWGLDAPLDDTSIAETPLTRAAAR